jgi:hypothetical protein
MRVAVGDEGLGGGGRTEKSNMRKVAGGPLCACCSGKPGISENLIRALSRESPSGAKREKTGVFGRRSLFVLPPFPDSLLSSTSNVASRKERKYFVVNMLESFCYLFKERKKCFVVNMLESFCYLCILFLFSEESFLLFIRRFVDVQLSLHHAILRK